MRAPTRLKKKGGAPRRTSYSKQACVQNPKARGGPVRLTARVQSPKARVPLRSSGACETLKLGFVTSGMSGLRLACGALRLGFPCKVLARAKP
eukprot:1189857-Prorocentrum_minimum.AAC.2